MRRIVLITTVAFISGLFGVSQGLGAGEYGQEDVSRGGAGMPQAESQSGAMADVQMDTNQVREMQRLLTEKGYDPGTADGVIGSRTKEAISNFQESEGLAVTGQPDEETLRALAPDAETQELLGLSPEFGEQDQMQQEPMQEPIQEPMQEPMQEPTQEPMQQDQMESPTGSDSMDTY